MVSDDGVDDIPRHHAEPVLALDAHGRRSADTPMFLRPPGAVNSASGMPGGGKPHGHGLRLLQRREPDAAGHDAPAAGGAVENRSDRRVGGAGPYTITFGPWVTRHLALTVTTLGQGTVTSSPAGINCGIDVQSGVPSGTHQVILTAAPSPAGSSMAGRALHGRKHDMHGRPSTATTTVIAEFYALGAAPPSAYGLHVVVNGTGIVTSAPAGISCGSTCSAAFAANYPGHADRRRGARVRRSPGGPAQCSGASTTCAVTMSQARRRSGRPSSPARSTR